ncbi:hypothetical protein BJY52DRAFT_1286681, partial [Lactarius psammicola]
MLSAGMCVRDERWRPCGCMMSSKRAVGILLLLCLPNAHAQPPQEIILLDTTYRRLGPRRTPNLNGHYDSVTRPLINAAKAVIERF